MNQMNSSDGGLYPVTALRIYRMSAAGNVGEETVRTEHQNLPQISKHYKQSSLHLIVAGAWFGIGLVVGLLFDLVLGLGLGVGLQVEVGLWIAIGIWVCDLGFGG